jgi:hypothetical protein
MIYRLNLSLIPLLSGGSGRAGALFHTLRPYAITLRAIALAIAWERSGDFQQRR